MTEHENKAVDFAIELDVRTLRRSATGRIAGVIFIRFGRAAFPEPTWSDVVAAVLTEWARSLLLLLYAGESAATWHFMDGPFRVELRRSSDKALTISALEDRMIGSRAHHVIHDVTLQSVVSQFRNATNLFLAACNERGWRSPDLAELSSVSEEMALKFDSVPRER